MHENPSRALETVLLSEQASALRGPTVGLSVLALSLRGMRAGQGAGWPGCPGRDPKTQALIQGVSPRSAPPTLAHLSQCLLFVGNCKGLR